ncbi:UMP kinase [Candidatus Beckwithbacteria bacterium]|nr:UMP kinase [Candidatus Beckwithbacteria bacterium]
MEIAGKTKFKRVLIKLTGEFLSKEGEKGINFHEVDKVAQGILEIKQRTGSQMAIVVGGGNLMRGRDIADSDVDRAVADYIGSLGTVMNGLALEESLNRLSGDSRKAVLLTALPISAVAEPFYRKRALKHLDSDKIVVLGGGTGNPFFTTDSAAALRAAELKCEVILKGSTIDGIYTADPKKDPTARKYKYLTYQTALEKKLEVMDNNAFAICQRENIPILVFQAEDLGSILSGEKVGTMVSNRPDEFFE